MGDELPTEYDCIVIGTGMTESIIAAAASRIGKRVLHLDSNEYYGGLWASFNFDGMQSWLDDCRKLSNDSGETKCDSPNGILKDGETAVPAGNQFSTIFNITEDWYISEGRNTEPSPLSDSKRTQTEEEPNKDANGDEASATDAKGNSGQNLPELENLHVTPAVTPQSKSWTQAKIKSEQRKFNLDLAPKLLFARGSLVELLISSNIARYAEFRCVTRVLTWINGQLEGVPCSRADVFSTRNVSVVEKRMLMKLLTVCMDYENQETEFQGFEEKTFLDYLKSKKLTQNLVHYVLFAISMSTKDTPCLEGVGRTKRFLDSLGRYGNTPFLWPMYGSGEIPQCFCRLCAVFGGVYHLKRAAEALIVGHAGEDTEEKCLGIISAGQRLDAAQLVLGVGFAPPQFLKKAPSGGLSRGIFITNKSIMPADKETLTLLQFPTDEGKGEPVTVIELGPTTSSCPKGLFVVHMTSKQVANAKEDLDATVKLLLCDKPCPEECLVTADTPTQTIAPGEEHRTEVEEKIPEPKVVAGDQKPQILWSLYFNCPETSGFDLSASVPDNVYLCSGPDIDLDFEYAVKQAREIFSKMYPESEFLPRAPDPEEIVLEGDETVPGPAFEGEIGEGGTLAASEKETETAEKPDAGGDATEVSAEEKTQKE